jgi:hypothetical protein
MNSNSTAAILEQLLWDRNPVGIGLKRIKIQSWNFLKTDIIFQRYEEFKQKEEPGAESVIQYLWIRIQKANSLRIRRIRIRNTRTKTLFKTAFLKINIFKKFNFFQLPTI